MRYAILFIALALTGCQEVVKVDHCSGWEPVMPHRGDVLTQATSDAQLKQVCTGYHYGCWSPANIAQACAAAPAPATSTAR